MTPAPAGRFLSPVVAPLQTGMSSSCASLRIPLSFSTLHGLLTPAEFVAAFGRPVIARQRFSSPFVSGTQAVTFFHETKVRGAGRSGWFFLLNRIDRQVPAGDKNITHRYEF